MKLTKGWAIFLVLLPIAACSSSKPVAVVSPTPMPPPLAAADQTFLNTAAASDASEIQSSQLAQTKARSPRVKAFATKMIADHTATTQQLTSIAQSKNATVSAVPTDMQQTMETKLEADSPRAFDRDYTQGQVASHQAAVTAFQTEIESGTDPDLKAFAQATLPTLKQHLALAQRNAGRG